MKLANSLTVIFLSLSFVVVSNAYAEGQCDGIQGDVGDAFEPHGVGEYSADGMQVDHDGVFDYIDTSPGEGPVEWIKGLNQNKGRDKKPLYRGRR